jgi:Glycosyltransferase sugar-binding region containing DXD motif
MQYHRDSKAIPSEIHFIWLGSPLPEKYLKTLLRLLPIARRSGFTLNLWVDNPSNYYRSVDKFFVGEYFPDLQLSAQHSFLQIKTLSELKAEMNGNDFFSYEIIQVIKNDQKSATFTRSQNRLKDFWHCVNLEMIGAKNFAAVSDLLRYAILYLKGGYYFDTDTQFVFKDIKNGMDTLVAESLPLGFKANIDCCFKFMNPDNKVHYEKQLVAFRGLTSMSCNDVIAVSPLHPIMKKALVSVILAYNGRNDFKTPYQNKTAMDDKRYRSVRNDSDDPRRRGTISLSGPGLLADSGKIPSGSAKKILEL